jgi:hypothetical protein
MSEMYSKFEDSMTGLFLKLASPEAFFNETLMICSK